MANKVVPRYGILHITPSFQSGIAQSPKSGIIRDVSGVATVGINAKRGTASPYKSRACVVLKLMGFRVFPLVSTLLMPRATL
jgi:hypothetical protein